MCTNNLAIEKFKELEDFIDNLEDKQGALIEVLHKAQHLFGYLPPQVQTFVANKLDINVSKVCGVVSFYSYFNTTPKGKYVVSICLGTACFVKGAGDVLKEFEKQLNIKAGETTSDSIFTIDVLRCVGACGLAPVVTVNNKVYGHFTPDMVSKILNEYSELEG